MRAPAHRGRWWRQLDLAGLRAEDDRRPGEWLAAVLAVRGPRQARRRSPRQSVPSTLAFRSLLARLRRPIASQGAAGGQLTALGPLGPGLLDLRGDVKFCQVLVADLGRRFGAVTGPDGGLRGVWLDQVTLDEPRLLGGELSRIEPVVFVHRLREVMALVGFNRYEPASTDEKGEPAGSGRSRGPTLGLAASGWDSHEKRS